jgi:hypothetical protein
MFKNKAADSYTTYNQARSLSDRLIDWAVVLFGMGTVIAIFLAVVFLSCSGVM